jgi:hypothetical protein
MPSRVIARVTVLALFAAAAMPISGQAPPPGGGPQGETATPRWPDGRVNLGSAAGRKGYWEIRPGLGGFPRAADVPFLPWSRALYEYRTARADLYPPLVRCKPAGGPSFMNAPGFEIVDVPDLAVIFILNIAGPHTWRTIHMDGRPHPQRVRPTYLGHSIGRWDGDTLVVDSVGFNEKQWLAGSYPTTDRLHLTERFSRPNLRTLVYEATIDDPGAYTAPWSVKWTISETTKSSWIPDGEVFEYICQDDRQ